MPKSRSGEKIKMLSYDELLGGANLTEGRTDLEISKIYAFENHPFRVVDDEKMTELVESIKKNGIVSPVLVRPDDEGTYEMISGHRRMHAAQVIGLKIIPAIVREMTNDEAVIFMVDANIQREEILPSEKAFAYKMRMEAMNRQGQRTDLTSGHNGHKSESETCGQDDHKSESETCGQDDHKFGPNKKSRDLIGEQVSDSGRTISRYIRLTFLVPGLLELVDKGRLSVTPAVDVSYFPEQIQKYLVEYINENGFLKADQVARLKRELRQGENMKQDAVITYLNASMKVKSSRKVTISEKKLDEFFPIFFSSIERERIIIKLLEKWKREQGGF